MFCGYFPVYFSAHICLQMIVCVYLVYYRKMRSAVVVGARSGSEASKGRCRWIAERLLRSEGSLERGLPARPEGSFSSLSLPF